MLATAFLTSDMETILDAGATALDPRSVMSRIVADVRQWHTENPKDWRASRRLTRDKYCKYGGRDMRDRNGVWLNGASTIAALLYGDGDFVQTIRSAFNFGWDADNNAAASGAILGVVKGNRRLSAQGWNIKDLFRNTSRDNMPADETITSFGDRLIDLARRNITEHGGAEASVKGRSVFRIPVERPANVEKIPDPRRQYDELRGRLGSAIEQGIAAGTTERQKACAAYLAICLDFAPKLMSRYPERWQTAVAALSAYPRVLQVIFYESPIPAGRKLAEKASAAGVIKPAASLKLWS
jgi:ADP-ribosylglycohydrolase